MSIVNMNMWYIMLPFFWAQRIFYSFIISIIFIRMKVFSTAIVHYKKKTIRVCIKRT